MQPGSLVALATLTTHTGRSVTKLLCGVQPRGEHFSREAYPLRDRGNGHRYEGHSLGGPHVPSRSRDLAVSRGSVRDADIALVGTADPPRFIVLTEARNFARYFAVNWNMPPFFRGAGVSTVTAAVGAAGIVRLVA